MSRGRAMREVMIIAALALTLRCAVPVARAFAGEPERGYDYYVEMADNLLAGRGLYRTMPYGQGDRWAIRTPLYPLVLAAFRATPGAMLPKVALLGALAGALTCLLARSLAARLFGAPAGLAAGLVAAAWPHAVVHDGALQDTALYTVLFIACLVSFLRVPDAERPLSTAALGGAAGALAVLTRVTLLPSVILLIAWTALRGGPRKRAAAGIALAVVALGLLPWTARNAVRIGRPILTSDVGRSLWLGNNSQTFSVYPRQSIDRAEERAWAALPESVRADVRALGADELRQDAWFRRAAVAWIRDEPGRAMTGAARKAWAGFSPWHSPVGSPLKQAAHLLSYGPIALLAAATVIVRRRDGRLVPLLLAIAALALQSAVFFGHSGYRAYLDPLLIVLASPLLARAATTLRSALRPA